MSDTTAIATPIDFAALMANAAKQAMVLAIALPTSYPSDKFGTQQDWIGGQIHRFKLAINNVYDPKQ